MHALTSCLQPPSPWFKLSTSPTPSLCSSCLSRFQSPCYHPDFLWGNWDLHDRKSCVLSEAICNHRVVCFAHWGSTEICPEAPLCGLDTFIQRTEVTCGAFGAYWQTWGTVGPEWSQSEGTTISIAAPVEEGTALCQMRWENCIILSSATMWGQ